MAEDRRLDSILHLADFNKQQHRVSMNASTPPPLTHQLGPTPPPAHLGHTPPPPAIQVHITGSVSTPPPAHMRDRNSPGLQLLGQIAASPQLRIQGTPSPHMSHSSHSPAHGLLMTDRPSSRDYSMTPPREQVFPHAGIQPELLRVLRPGVALPSSTSSHLTLPNGPGLSPLSQQLAAHQALYQQQQAMGMNHMRQLNSMQQQQSAALTSNHYTNNNTITSTSASSIFQPYNIPVPEPSPHHELKMLANIASTELQNIAAEQQLHDKQIKEAEEKRIKLEPTYRADINLRSGGNNPELPHSLRIHNLNNFPSSTMYSSTSYRSKSIAMQRARATCITNSAKSLDILRQVVQKSINRELHTIIEKYLKEYFRPALENIRSNNGQSSVSEEHINCICRKILEEAGRSYVSRSRSEVRDRSRSITPDIPDNLSDAGSSISVSSAREPMRLPFSRIKRKPAALSDTESDTGSVHRRKRRTPIGPSGLTRESVKREAPRWNPDRLTTDTKVIMGPKANKALGLGAARGRIYTKHPEIFKYSCDAQDKQWLYENSKIPATGGKVYLMLLEDVDWLTSSPEYKNMPVERQHLKGFTVSSFMIEKMKDIMQSLRTDIPQPTSQRPAQKSVLNSLSQQEQYDVDSDKNVPFTSAASSGKSLLDGKFGINSPANTEELELLSSEEQEDPPVSPFGSADDYAPVSPNTTNTALKPAQIIGLQESLSFGMP